MAKKNANVITGTPVQFANNLSINGVKVSQPAFSILASLFADNGIRKVGSIRSPGARKSSSVWEVNLNKFPNAAMETIPVVEEAAPAVEAEAA